MKRTIRTFALLAAAPDLWGKLQHAAWFVHLDGWAHLKDRAPDAVPAGSAAVNPVLAAIGAS